MGLSTLISAIEYLEYMEQLEGVRQSPGNLAESAPASNPLHFRRLDSTLSGSLVIKQEKEEEQYPIEEVPVKVEREDNSSRNVSKTSGLSAGMLARRRLMHNILEKSRRAQMRGCLNALKEILPAPTSHPGTPYGRILTTSTTLVNSVKYIKQLEEDGGKLEGEVKKLQKIKKEMEEQLVKLKGQVGGDMEVEVSLKLEEENEVGISTAAATPSQPGLPSPRSSLDISPMPGVTMEEAVTITPGNFTKKNFGKLKYFLLCILLICLKVKSLFTGFPSTKLKEIYSEGSGSRGGSNQAPPPSEDATNRWPAFGGATPVLCEILRRPSPPSPHCYPPHQGRGSPYGYFYNDHAKYPNPPSPLNPPNVQFLFVNNFFNMIPFCSLPGGSGGGGCGGGVVSGSAASPPPSLDYFTQGLSGGGGGCYIGGGGHNNNRIFK